MGADHFRSTIPRSTPLFDSKQVVGPISNRLYPIYPRTRIYSKRRPANVHRSCIRWPKKNSEIYLSCQPYFRCIPCASLYRFHSGCLRQRLLLGHPLRAPKIADRRLRFPRTHWSLRLCYLRAGFNFYAYRLKVLHARRPDAKPFSEVNAFAGYEHLGRAGH